MKSGIFQKTADTSIIENRLRSTAVGDVVTYDAMTVLLGRDVREYCRSSIASARRTLELESIFFETVAGEGVIRIAESDAVKKTVPAFINRARRAAGRGMRVLSHVQYDQLDDETKQKHLSTSAQLGAIKLFSSAKAEKRIGEKVKEATKTLAIGETLKLFGG